MCSSRRCAQAFRQVIELSARFLKWKNQPPCEGWFETIASFKVATTRYVDSNYGTGLKFGLGATVTCGAAALALSERSAGWQILSFAEPGARVKLLMGLAA